MALVSSGALHSCEDHLQTPRSVSAARLESLAFIQAQNGNASNSLSSSPPTPLLFLSSPSAPISLTPLPQEGEVSLLGSSAHLAYFSASALCGESAPLSSTLLLSRFYHHSSLHSLPSSIHSLHCVEKNKIFEGSLLRLTSFSV